MSVGVPIPRLVNPFSPKILNIEPQEQSELQEPFFGFFLSTRTSQENYIS
jgi:hypothetical protein